MKIKAKATYDHISTEELNGFLNEQDKVLKRLSDIIEVFQKTSTATQASEIFYVKDALKHVLNHMKNDFLQLNLTLELNYDKAIHIQGNKDILSEVFFIVLQNAIDNFKDHSVINPKITFHTSLNNAKLFIIIEDNGGGIKLTPIEKIFEPYVTMKNQNGIGLGLYIAQKNIQEYFNGLINVANAKNGTRFEIVIPKI